MVCRRTILGILLGFLLVGPAAAAEAPRMTPEELRSRLGGGEVTVIDVRSGGDWIGSPQKIAGAVREDPREVGAWASGYPRDRTLVLYCS